MIMVSMPMKLKTAEGKDVKPLIDTVDSETEQMAF